MKTGMMLVAACALLAGGCATGTGGWEVALREGAGNAHRVRVDDEDFAETLAVERTCFRRATSGFALAEVGVRNTEDDDFAFQYRFEFFDAEGSPLQSETRAWEQLVVHGNESRTLQATAPSADAVGFTARARRIR